MAASLQGFLGFFCFTAHLSTAKRRGKEGTLLNQLRYCTGLADCGPMGIIGEGERVGTTMFIMLGYNNNHRCFATKVS